MADTYTVTIPKITAAAFSINPCTINEKIVLTVTVVEQSVVLTAETIYAGEIYAGER
jgi:hypothetical protein